MRFLHDHTWPGLHRSWCLLGLLTLPLLAGCGGGGGGSNGNPGTGTTTTGTNTGVILPNLTLSAPTPTGLTATISEPSGTVAVGGTVTYTLTLTNKTATAIPIHTTSTPTIPSVGLIVRNSSGSVTFSPLPGEPPYANGSLAAGQSLTTTVAATGFTTAGTYGATATFSNDTGSTAASVGPLTVTAQ